MYNQRNTAKDYGERLRKFRCLQGWSQKILAEKISTSPQNISKYEKEGIHDIEVIHRLSNVLGYDLLQDEKDTEGSVGEVGQEILSILLKNEGSVHVSYLLDEKELYGLSKDDILHELTKLNSIGMIVREQYIDFNGKEYDLVFITAKGIIGFKRISGGSLDKFSNFKSYEQYCNSNACYQDYIDSKPEQSMINKLGTVGSYRYHLIRYIRNNYQIMPLGQRTKSEHYCGFNAFRPITPLKTIHSEGIPESAAQNTAYQIIMQSMIRMVTKEKIGFPNYYTYEESEQIDDDFASSLKVEIEYLSNRFHGEDQEEEQLLVSLSNTMEVPYNWFLESLEENRQEQIIKQHDEKLYNDWQDKLREKKEMLESLEEEDDYLSYSEEIYGFEPIHHCDKDIFEYWANLKDDPCPLNWFSKEEIEAFIKANYVPAANEEEEKIEADIQFILRRRPDIASSFFRFPLEWRLNGLEDLVLDTFNVAYLFED